MQLKDIKNKYILAPLLLGLVSFFASCEKHEDKPIKDWDGEGFYCNDPEAVNYNWGFPGNINDSLCIYPTDLFVGDWILTDTVFNDTFAIVEIQERTISFVNKSDDSMSHLMELQGYCNNNTPIVLQANRFMLASLVDLIEDDLGQLGCDGESILTGFIRLKDFQSDTLYLQIMRRSAQDDNFTIKGTAFKN